MSKRTITVTGVAGFLGSNLLERLLAKGHTVIGLDNLSMGHVSNIEPFLAHERFQFVQADATDPTVVDEIHADVGLVMHLAAFRSRAMARRSIRCASTITRRTTCSSSPAGAAVSACWRRLPMSTGAIRRSRSAKSITLSKLFDEHLAFAYADTGGFPVVVLGIFGSYGPRQPLRGGAAAGGVHRRGADNKVIPITRSSGP
jgi:nucleoside-diphosphate-sugar epimerase